MKTNVHFLSYLSYLARLFLEREVFRTRVVEEINTLILCSVTFVWKSCRWWDNVKKYCRAEQATDDNMAHALCMLDTYGYKHTLAICNIYCFSTTAVVAQTRLSVALCVHCVNFLSKEQRCVGARHPENLAAGFRLPLWCRWGACSSGIFLSFFL
jgi:hypothetical protein